MKRMSLAVATIDEYLAPLAADKRGALEKLRTAIQQAAPQAVETISYGLPAFKLDGKALVYFGAAAGHCAFYPGSATLVDSMRDELRAYSTSKGTIRFQPGKPLAATLVKRMVKARIAENAARRPGPAASRGGERVPGRRAARARRG
jgi:uncharacterized protein YdhG (YjbR/CyaY superfamily)